MEFFKHEKASNKHEESKRIQIMFDSMPLCANLWDNNLKLLDCNKAAIKMFELRDKKEYIEKFFELSPKYQPCGSLSYEKSLELIKKTFEEGYSRVEWMHNKLNGEPMPCEVTLVRIEYKDNYVVGGYVRDLRENKKMMYEIERRANLLQTVNRAAVAMLTTADDGNFEDTLLSGLELICRSLDLDRVEIWQNEVIEEELHFVLKYSQQSEIGRQKPHAPIDENFTYSVLPGWKDRFLRGEYLNCPLNELTPAEQVFFDQYKIKSVAMIPLFLQDNFWGLFTIDNCRQERIFTEEEIDIFRSTGLMMTSAVNRHEQAARIREADELTQLMLDVTPLSCNLWDKDLNILDCNQEAVKLFGCSSKQEYLERFFDLVPEYQPCGGLSRKLMQDNGKKALETGYNRLEFVHQTLSGEALPSEVTLLRIERKGEYILAGYQRDLREHKAILAEMQKAENDLRLARDAAETANFAKSVFLAQMSHEIRTPLNSIMGFSELALDNEPSLKTRDYLGKIFENAEGLLQIINDILDISKVESGRMELENIPFDMRDLFTSCRAIIMPKAFEKGIMLHFYAEPSTGRVPLGDPTRLRQVFVNLLSNAVKFTNTGIVKLYAEIKHKNERCITMHFEVRDSGIGMTEKQIEKIFDPFTQAESGTTRKFGGTGLGLAITKNIVELMGGVLLVESTPGVGSKFSFNLTFDTIDVSDDDMPEKRIVFNEFEKPTFEGEILLVEDNVMNQQVICEHLTRIGISTIVAENGQIGVDMVKSRMEKGEKMFDLIFMDMHMPVMDGLEASAKIIELNTKVPIVAMTANIMSSDKEIYKANGMHDCLGKPFTSQELWRCLMKYLKPVSRETMNASIRHKKGPLGLGDPGKSDSEFQRELQQLFYKSNIEKFDEITKALNEDNITLARRLTHTLKGNAGQLGKDKLQQAAANIEHRLKDGKNLVTPEQMTVLETELNAVLEELGAPVPTTQTEPNGKFLDTKSALELMEKLEPMLKMGNAEGRKFIVNIRRIPDNNSLKTEGLKNLLIEQIEDFDFDEALVSLSELKKAFGTVIRE